MQTSRRVTTVVFLLFSAVTVSASSGDPNLRAVVEQALDQPTQLSLTDVTLEEALREISQKTGVGISVVPDAIAMLPYGQNTKVNVTLDNIRLRQGIEALCNQLGMTYELSDTGVRIVASPALARLGQAATWDELQRLSALMNAEWTDEGLEQLHSKIRFSNVGESHEQAWNMLSQKLRESGNGQSDQVLTRACQAIGCSWHPSGKDIVVIPIADQTARQLQQPVSLRFNNRSLAEVLRGLSRQVGVAIKVDPAAAAELPLAVKQNFSLLAEGATAEEALEQISIATGLAYRIVGDSVYLQRSHITPAAGQAEPLPTRTRDPMVGKVIVPSEDGNYQYEWVIRESDLSPEENAQRKQLVEKAVAAMKQSLANEE